MIDCKVYIGCKMTGMDRVDQVRRAEFICDILKQYGLTPIHPVLEEKVEAIKGPLVQTAQKPLETNWKRDKLDITYKAHVCLFDGADTGSVGMTREYRLSRGTLWKPSVILWDKPRGYTVADFEDDYICFSPYLAAMFIRANWGTRKQRILWRIKMLIRCLPKFIYHQLWQWR